MSEEQSYAVRVRFRVYHGGFDAHPGDVKKVARDWAEKAVKSGIVEYVDEEPKSENKPDGV